VTVVANPPIWQQNRQYSARLDRTVVDLIFTEGVVNPGGGDFEVIETSPQSLSVAVGIGRAVIQGDDETRQGKYLVVNDAVLNVPITAAPVAPNDRIDLIVLRVNDPVAGSTRTPPNVAEVVAITGTPGVTPVAPALPVTAIPLAEVYVAAGATFIATADITDVRAAATSETFTVRSNFEVLTTAERNALTPYVGQAIFNSTTSQVEVWDGSQWQPVVAASLASLSDVDLAGLQDGDILVYDLASGDWLAARQRAVEDDQQIIAVSVFA
jgi:hypothetical protein